MFASKNEVSVKIADKTKEYCCQAKSNPSNLSMGSERIKRSTVLGMKCGMRCTHLPFSTIHLLTAESQ